MSFKVKVYYSVSLRNCCNFFVLVLNIKTSNKLNMSEANTVCFEYWIILENYDVAMLIQRD